MRCALVLFGFVLGACAGPTRAPVSVASTVPAAATALPRPVVSSPALSCSATPSTVYGNEPVTFELRSSSPARVQLELSGQRGEHIDQAVVVAPSAWKAPDLPSGDFTLLLGQSATCKVTVNRDLVRATSAVR